MAKKDNKWFEILSGKSKPNLKNKDEVEAAQLREAIGSYEKSIGLDKITPENSYFRFQQLLKASQPQKIKTGLMSKLKQYKWETARLIAATAAGIAIATLPTVQMATRGDSESSWQKIIKPFSSSSEIINNEIILTDKNPFALSKEIINSCIKANVSVKILNEKKLTLVIYDLHAMNENEVGLKAILKIENNAHGNIKVII